MKHSCVDARPLQDSHDCLVRKILWKLDLIQLELIRNVKMGEWLCSRFAEGRFIKSNLESNEAERLTPFTTIILREWFHLLPYNQWGVASLHSCHEDCVRAKDLADSRK